MTSGGSDGWAQEPGVATVVQTRRAAVLVSAGLSIAGATGCGAAPSCAGGRSPPDVIVTVDAAAWAQAHPDIAVLIACAHGAECRKITAALLHQPRLVIGEVPGSLPQAQAVTVRFRALASTGRIMLRKTVSERPRITTAQGPCGRYDVVTLNLVL
jgi:hypothetical protein